MADEIKKVKIQVRRELESELTDLSIGEPALSSDTSKFYVGTGNGNKAQLAKQSQVDTIQTDVTNAKTNITSLQTDNTKNKQDITQLKTDTSGLRNDLNDTIDNVGDLGTAVETNTNDISTLKGTKTEVETARNGAASLDERLKGMEKADNRQSWKVTATTQTRFTLTNGSYTVGSNSFAVFLEGVLQPTDAYVQIDSKNFDMVDPVPKDLTVTAIWKEGKAPIQFGHNTTHYVGGQDPLDVTKLTNYAESVGNPLQSATNKTSSYVVPETFGAKGDGVTDDTEAIRQAIATGKEVHFDAKTYLVSIPTANTFFALEANGTCPKFQGVNGKTVLKLALDNSVAESSNSKSGILVAWNTEIQGITFDGGFNPANAKANLSAALQVGANSRVRGCEFKNSRGSNLGVTGSNVKVNFNKFEKFGDHAVYIHQEAANSRISNIRVFENEMIEDNTYHNGVQGGTVRGVVKLRDNVEDVDIYANRITGDQCVLLSGNAGNVNAIANNINVYKNKMFPTYSGVHVDTDLTPTDGGFRITRDNINIDSNVIAMVGTTGIVGVALENSTATITNNEIISTVAENTNSGITDFATGDQGKSIITGNKFRKVRLGIYRAGSESIIEDNEFHDITATGGVGIYSQYADRVINNSFFNCIEGLRLLSARTTKKSVYDNNSFYDCVKGVVQKNGASGYTFINNRFFDCTTASIEIENPTAFRAEKNFNNVAFGGAGLPEVVGASSVLHSPFDLTSRATLPGGIVEYRKKMTFIEGVNGVAEVASLTITGSATTAGNVTITLDGVPTTVALTTSDNTATLVATKIRAATFAGWTTGGAGTTVTFTSTTKGSRVDATYSAGSTGAAGTMTTTTQGVTGTADEVWVCVKKANDSYDWAQLF